MSSLLCTRIIEKAGKCYGKVVKKLYEEEIIMNGIKKVLSMVLAIVCIIGLFPTAKVEASTVTVNGGYTTRANAYSWGTYSTTNTITVVLP